MASCQQRDLTAAFLGTTAFLVPLVNMAFTAYSALPRLWCQLWQQGCLLMQPFNMLPYTVQPSVASLTKPSELLSTQFLWRKSLYLYFSSFFPYISVPISMFSLSSCDLSLMLSLPLLQIVTRSLTSLLLCHHLWPFMMSTLRIGLASSHPFSALPDTAWPSVASLIKPSWASLYSSVLRTATLWASPTVLAVHPYSWALPSKSYVHSTLQ